MQEGIKVNKIILVITLITIIISCSEKKEQRQLSDLEIKMNDIAEGYVKLVLKVGQYDQNYVDAFYGPVEWKPADKNLEFDSSAYNEMSRYADSLLTELELLSEYNATELETLRYRYLYKQLLSIKTKIEVLNGTILPFDLEAKAFYDVEVPDYSEEQFQIILNELDKTVPGKGDLAERVVSFNKKFEIPKSKIKPVFKAAIEECKKRTGKFIDLPAGEEFEDEYVENEPWGAYNWYKGNLFSLIQIATDFPVYIDKPVGLAAHEGYPGHHVFNAMLEQKLVKDRGWIEYTVYPLYSPISLIAEGTAVYGEDLLFPDDERIQFEKEFLFPIAGLDTTDYYLYYKINDLQDKLSGSEIIAAKNYLDGNWSREETIKRLQIYQLRSKERAEKFVSFIETYRSYVVNYVLGEKIVKEYILKNGGTDDNLVRKWELFKKLISTPQTPSGLID